MRKADLLALIASMPDDDDEPVPDPAPGDVAEAVADATADVAEAVAAAVADAQPPAPDPEPLPTVAELAEGEAVVIAAQADATVAVIEAEAARDERIIEAEVNAELTLDAAAQDDEPNILDDLLGPAEAEVIPDVAPAAGHRWFQPLGRRNR